MTNPRATNANVVGRRLSQVDAPSLRGCLRACTRRFSWKNLGRADEAGEGCLEVGQGDADLGFVGLLDALFEGALWFVEASKSAFGFFDGERPIGHERDEIGASGVPTCPISFDIRETSIVGLWADSVASFLTVPGSSSHVRRGCEEDTERKGLN